MMKLLLLTLALTGCMDADRLKAERDTARQDFWDAVSRIELLNQSLSDYRVALAAAKERCAR